MAQQVTTQDRTGRIAMFMRAETGTFIMAAVILVLGFYLMFPVILMLVLSFNVADDFLVPPIVWGLENWTPRSATRGSWRRSTTPSPSGS